MRARACVEDGFLEGACGRVLHDGILATIGGALTVDHGYYMLVTG